MGSVRKRPAPQRREPSPADIAEAKALDEAVETMIRGPLANWDHTRPLGSLNRDDLRKLAVAGITGWVLKRAELSCDPKADPISTAASAE